MTGLTNEIIGLVVLVLVVSIALVIRHLLVASQREEERSTIDGAQVGQSSGPAPVWAGNAVPPELPPGNFTENTATGGAKRPPPQVLPSVSPRPDPAPRPVLPPPVVVPAASKHFGEPPRDDVRPGDRPEPAAGETDLPASDAAETDRPEPDAAETDPPGNGDQESGPTGTAGCRSGVESTATEHFECADVLRGAVVAVPGNAGHPSRVVHVSNMRTDLAAELPTDWLVVTPIDLLGEGSRVTVPNAAAPKPAPPATTAPATTAPATTAPAFTAPRATDADHAAITVPQPGPAAPNPFTSTPGPAAASELGMPSNLLTDLLEAD